MNIAFACAQCKWTFIIPPGGQGPFTHTVNVNVFFSVLKWTPLSPMVLFIHSIKKIKGTADQNNCDFGGTCKQNFTAVLRVKSFYKMATTMERHFRIEPFAGGLLEGEDDENWTDGDDDDNDGDDGGFGEEDVEFSDGEKFMFNNTEIQDFS